VEEQSPTPQEVYYEGSSYEVPNSKDNSNSDESYYKIKQGARERNLMRERQMMEEARQARQQMIAIAAQQS